MSNDNTRLTDYETKEKLDKLMDIMIDAKKPDPHEPQWDYNNPVNSKEGMPVSAHWPECWRVHHECATQEVERLLIAVEKGYEINLDLKRRLVNGNTTK